VWGSGQERVSNCVLEDRSSQSMHRFRPERRDRGWTNKGLMLPIFGRAADGELSRDVPPGVGCVTAARSRGSLTNTERAKRKNDCTGAKRHLPTLASGCEYGKCAIVPAECPLHIPGEKIARFSGSTYGVKWQYCPVLSFHRLSFEQTIKNPFPS